MISTNPKKKPARLGHDGMTLIELMVGFSLAAVAAVVVYTVFVSTQGAYHDTKDITEVQGDARVVLGMIAQEIRAAGSDPNNDDALFPEPLAQCDEDTLRMQSDFDGNGTFDALAEPPEDVIWFYDAGSFTIVRRTPAGDMPILRNVTDVAFAYLDDQGNALDTFPLDLETRRRVRAVRVEIQVRVSRDINRTWTTVAALRNDAPTI